MCLGIDLFPGREGGTWLGFSKTGKFGVLTNYRQSPDLISDKAKGRGHLATDFLNSTKSVKEYINEIKQNGHCYNGFNLLVGQISFTSETEVSCYCNQEENAVQELPPGFHCLSNRLLNFHWPKVVYGKQHFKDIVERSRNKEELIGRLFELLNDKRRSETINSKSQVSPSYLLCPSAHSTLKKCSLFLVYLHHYKYKEVKAKSRNLQSL